MKQVELFKFENQERPFEKWINSLDSRSQLKIYAYIDRLMLSASKKNIKALGNGVFELKIDFGPGYRIYFSEPTNLSILILLGGDKSTQFRDILKAKKYWELANESR